MIGSSGIDVRAIILGKRGKEGRREEKVSKNDMFRKRV